MTGLVKPPLLEGITMVKVGSSLFGLKEYNYLSTNLRNLEFSLISKKRIGFLMTGSKFCVFLKI